MKYSSSVNNYRETPYIVSDTFANIGNYTATIKGAIYVARDGASLNEPSIFQANGTSWVAIGSYGIGTDATLQDVTTNGNTTNQGITVTAGGVSTNTLTVTSLTPKSVTFVGTADLITEDNTNFVWDNTNKWLGIQTSVPSAEVDIHTTTATPAIVINNTAGLSSRIGFLNTNSQKWTIGNSATNTFNFYNSILASIAAYFDGADNSATFNGSVQALSAGGSRDINSRFNGSIVDAGSYVAVKAIAKFSNNGSGNIAKIILSDIVNADCSITFQPSATIANSLFGIGINASAPQFALLGSGDVGINTSTISQPSAGATTLRILGGVTTKAGAIVLDSSDSSVSAYIYPDNTSGLSINTSTSHPITLRTNGTTRATIAATTGEIVINTSNAGLQFTNSSALVNSVLNDYEKGTWTPTITAVSGSYTTVTQQTATYTKIGRMVIIQLYFIVSNKGTGSGGVQISNLPFTSNSGSAGVQYSGTGVDTTTGILQQIVLAKNSTIAFGYNYLGLDGIVVSHGNNFTLTYEANF